MTTEPGPTDQRSAPVFVAGCGRSGTTLLRTLLNAHPDVFMPNECLFLADYVRGQGNLPERLARWLFYREPQLRLWYQGPEHPVDDLASAIRFVHEQAMAGSGARRWGQKTPRFIRHMDAFDQLFPEIRWILVYRDPRAVVSSMLRSTRHTWSVRRATNRWLRDNQYIVDLLKGEGGPRSDRALIVKYEDFIGDPASRWGQICRFIDIRAIDVNDLARQAEADSYTGGRFINNAVREGLVPDRARLDAWRSHLSASQVAYIQGRCGSHMRLMGYSPDPGIPSRVRQTPMQALAGVKDIWIPFEYLWYWPEYLIWTVVRRLSFALGVVVRGLQRLGTRRGG